MLFTCSSADHNNLLAVFIISYYCYLGTDWVAFSVSKEPSPQHIHLLFWGSAVAPLLLLLFFVVHQQAAFHRVDQLKTQMEIFEWSSREAAPIRTHREKQSAHQEVVVVAVVEQTAVTTNVLTVWPPTPRATPSGRRECSSPCSSCFSSVSFLPASWLCSAVYSVRYKKRLLFCFVCLAFAS